MLVRGESARQLVWSQTTHHQERPAGPADALEPWSAVAR